MAGEGEVRGWAVSVIWPDGPAVSVVARTTGCQLLRRNGIVPYMAQSVKFSARQADMTCDSVRIAGLGWGCSQLTAETRFTVAGTSLESGMNRQSSMLTACGLHERGNLRLRVDRDRLQRAYTSRGAA